MEAKIKEIVRAIKSKKELASLDDAYVREKVGEHLRKHPGLKGKLEASRDFPQFSRSQEYRKLLKEVRKGLRAIYGVFQEKDRRRLLHRLKETEDQVSIAEEILETHTSTRERLPHYPALYSELASRLPAPKTLLDLGCGMNPLSCIYFPKGWDPLITATDLSSEDMAFLAACLEALHAKAETFALDLAQEPERVAEHPADLVLMFKLLDSLEEAQRHISYRLFEHLRARHAIVSFPTKSLGGKKTIARAGRAWFERLLERKGYSWETLEIPNELFYVVRLSPS